MAIKKAKKRVGKHSAPELNKSFILVCSSSRKVVGAKEENKNQK